MRELDTAPAYGFGRSEDLVGRAIAEHRGRERVLIATKAGLAWRAGAVYRDATAERIQTEIEDSVRRLGTSYIDIYQVHWPDPLVPVEETAAELRRLYVDGTIHAIGVSNSSAEQMATTIECGVTGIAFAAAHRRSEEVPPQLVRRRQVLPHRKAHERQGSQRCGHGHHEYDHDLIPDRRQRRRAR